MTRAVGRIVGAVDPDPPRLGVAVDRAVDLGVAGGGDHQPAAVEVAGPVRAAVAGHPVVRRDGVDDLGRDHVDPGPALDQAGHLLRRHPSAADDQARLAGQDEVDRVQRAVVRACRPAMARLRHRRPGRAARPLLLVEAEDLQLEGEVDLAQRGLGRAPR